MTSTTPADRIWARAQQVAEAELAHRAGGALNRDDILAIACDAYLQGRVDVRIERVQQINAEIDAIKASQAVA